MFGGIWKYISAGLGIGMVALAIWYQIKISGLHEDIEYRDDTIGKLAKKISEKDISIGSLRNDKSTLTNAIDRQNIMMEKQAASLVLKEKEVKIWKSKPDGDKYKKWYDTLKNVKHETKDNDINIEKCKGYIDVENATSGFDLDTL